MVNRKTRFMLKAFFPNAILTLQLNDYIGFDRMQRVFGGVRSASLDGLNFSIG